ncbi:Protein of unknown function DUF2650 family-containing protein [Aphelenchoides bicaudatus]|nr:Protein of unknown function DUF2650 family-containing protein [Aphelenchoides bicaudatus]
MSYTSAFLFVAFASAFTVLTTQADGTFDFSLKDSAPVCVGKICDSSNAFWYFSCCGNLLNDCCFHLQQWLLVTLIVLGVLTLASFAIGVIKCICCCNDR